MMMVAFQKIIHFPNSPVYSLGHRNPQGITWDNNGNMFVAEFGPEKNDEINSNSIRERIMVGLNKNVQEMIDFENAILML